MAAGFGLLRLSPEDFWSMTPREMASATSVLGTGRAAAPGRNDLAAMMRLFPDGAAERGRSDRARTRGR